MHKYAKSYFSHRQAEEPRVRCLLPGSLAPSTTRPEPTASLTHRPRSGSPAAPRCASAKIHRDGRWPRPGLQRSVGRCGRAHVQGLAEAEHLHSWTLAKLLQSAPQMAHTVPHIGSETDERSGGAC
eukprot:scaffold7768_cov277-Pinguiococcus_pyrenoidosus.AAC.1